MPRDRVGCVSCDPAPVMVEGVRRPCAFCAETAGVPPWFRGGTPVQKRRAILGRHPLNGLDLRSEGGTCGNCAHRVVNEMRGGRKFQKCDLAKSQTGGPGTDTRVSWPACTKWEAADAP